MPVAPPPGAARGVDSNTDQRVASQQAAVRAHPRRPAGYTLLAAAYLQKVRETGDAGFYWRADAAIDEALAVAPGDAAALTVRGQLRLARHDFRGGLSDGLRAHKRAPQVNQPYGVLVDAYVELGRYRLAERTLQRMIDIKPDLASYARVSYLRELHGDVSGALQAMRLAAAAGGQAPENAAYVNVLLGNLEFARGRYGAARRAYASALQRFPGYVPALAGAARVDSASGKPWAAIRGLRTVVDRLPLPEHVIALGEAELAAHRPVAARRDLELVRAQERLLRSAGVNTDVDLALFEASHGDPRRAVDLARSAWRSAPSVRSADALGWALARDGRAQAAMAWVPRALKLGSRDPAVLFRAGMTARMAGRRDQARTLLRRALAVSPHFSPLNAPRARQALAGL